MSKEIASEITSKVEEHLNGYYDNVEQTLVLLENLPIVIKYKKKIKELENKLLDAEKTILLLKTEKQCEKNLHLEVIEKENGEKIVTKDEIEDSSYPKNVTIEYKISGTSTTNSGIMSYTNETGGTTDLTELSLPYSKTLTKNVEKYEIITLYGSHFDGGSITLEILSR